MKFPANQFSALSILLFPKSIEIFMELLVSVILLTKFLRVFIGVVGVCHFIRGCFKFYLMFSGKI